MKEDLWMSIRSDRLKEIKALFKKKNELIKCTK